MRMTAGESAAVIRGVTRIGAASTVLGREQRAQQGA